MWIIKLLKIIEKNNPQETKKPVVYKNPHQCSNQEYNYYLSK